VGLFSVLYNFITSQITSLYSYESTPTFFSKFLRIVFDPENFYNLCYLAVSIIAFFTTSLVYCILLLDIVKRSDDLQNIIKSITYNITNLIKTILLGLIVIYFYAILSFVYFRDEFEEVT